MTVWYYDPVNGNDANAGTSHTAPKKNATAFTLSSGQHQLLQAADTTWYATKVAGGAALQISVDGAGRNQEFVIGVYDPLTGARIAGERARAWIDAGGSDLGINVSGSRSHHLIEGLGVQNVRRSSLNICGIYHAAGAGGYITIRNCEVRDVVDSELLGSGIKTQCNNVLIDGCYVHDCSDDLIFFAGDTIEVRNNLLVLPAWAGAGTDCIQAGGAAVTNFIVENNILDHRALNGKQCFIVQDTSVSLTARNRFRGNICLGGDMNLPLLSANEMKIVYIGAANTLVEGNYIVGGEYGIFCAATSGSETSQGVRVIGNAVIQNHAKGLYGVSLGSSGYSKAYNNTVVHLLGAAVNAGVGIQQFTNSFDTDCANNIVTGYLRGVRMVEYDAAHVRNNCLYANGTALVDNSMVSRSPDASNITLDPLFTADYRLTAESPCRGAGIFIPGAKHMGSQSMNPASPDIGAYRYFSPRASTQRTSAGRDIADRNPLRSRVSI